MKSYKRLVGALVLVFALVWGLTNLWLVNVKKNENRYYMVEIERVVPTMTMDMSQEELDKICNDSEYITRIVLCDSDEALTASSHSDYCLKKVGTQIYRFEYDGKANQPGNHLIINLIFVVALCLISIVLIYVYVRIIRPFSKLENVPYELSKGNLTLQLPEQKAKYFGKFIWGTNMLRENIESRRQKELDLHREKKLLLLSLTHDIKTPLSVIKLNTQALQRGLYKDEAKQLEALDSIINKVDEIEGYVTEITRASKEDFLDLQVKEEEFYLSSVVEKIRTYYKDKLALKKIQFTIQEYTDCLLSGDEDRLIEVIQNLMENAIKYGDGKSINIYFGEEEGCRLITVANTGASLQKDEYMKIFDSFYRGSNSGAQAGSGLGLYICRQLMSGMNGDIFVKENNNLFQITVVVRMS